MFMLDEARATFAAQKMDAKINVVQMSQTLDVEPRKVTKEELGTVGISSTLVLNIPDPIAYSNGCGLFTIGSTDGRESYTQITYSQLRTALHRKYTSTSPKWMWHEDKLFIINASIYSLNKIRVRGIFDRPQDVMVMKGLVKKLDPYAWEYPLSSKDLPTIYRLAFSGDLGWGNTAASAVNASANANKKDSELLNALKNLGANANAG